MKRAYYKHLFFEIVCIIVLLICVYQGLYFVSDTGAFFEVINTYKATIIGSGVGIVFVWRITNWSLHRVRAISHLYSHKKEVIQYRKVYERYHNMLPTSMLPQGGVGFIVTAHHKGYDTLKRLMRRMFETLILIPVDCTIAVMITNGPKGIQERTAIEEVKREYSQYKHIICTIIEQKGYGKRDALGDALEFLASYFQSRGYNQKQRLYFHIDGDILVNLEAFLQCFYFMSKYPKLGGATVHNIAEMISGTSSFEYWVRLRFLSRFIQLSSVVTVLTGKFSCYRAELVENPEFIQNLREHKVQVPNILYKLFKTLGLTTDFHMLSGDDKTTLYELMKNNWETMFLPYCHVVALEEQPGYQAIESLKEVEAKKGFHSDLPRVDQYIKNIWLYAAFILSTRYGGNMVIMAIEYARLGRKQIGTIRFISVWDQLFSLISVYLGLSLALYVSMIWGWKILVGYCIWKISYVAFSTYIDSTIMWYFTGRWEARFNMIWIRIMDHYVSGTGKLDRFWDMGRQKWGNQDIALSSSSSAHIFLTIMSLIGIFSFWVALAQGQILITFIITSIILCAIVAWNQRNRKGVIV